MIEISINDGTLNIIDWFQIAASIGTVIAALMALLTTIQNGKANKLLQVERHAMVKPSFKIRGHYEKRPERIIDLYLINIGFDRVMSSIDCDWDGTDGIKVAVKEKIKNNPEDHAELEVNLNFANCKEKEIKGTLSLSYNDILGKQYKESVEVEIIYHYDESFEEYNPVLSKLVHKQFD